MSHGTYTPKWARPQVPPQPGDFVRVYLEGDTYAGVGQFKVHPCHNEPGVELGVVHVVQSANSHTDTTYHCGRLRVDNHHTMAHYGFYLEVITREEFIQRSVEDGRTFRDLESFMAADVGEYMAACLKVGRSINPFE